MRIAKADLVPTEANLRAEYVSFAELATACNSFCEHVNTRPHRETARSPAASLDVERHRLHTLPGAPHTLALGTTRAVNTDQTIRFGSVRYSTPPGLVGEQVWVRADGDELVVVADLNAVPVRTAGRCCIPPLAARPRPGGWGRVEGCVEGGWPCRWLSDRRSPGSGSRPR